MLRFERNTNRIQEVRIDGRNVSDDERSVSDSIINQTRLRSITFDTFNSMTLNSWQDALYKSQYSYNDNTVHHFGINIISPLPDGVNSAINECGGLVKGAKSASSASKPSRIKATSLEKTLLENAITELLKPDCKVVVVDIFHRDTSGKNNDGKIESKDNHTPEIHSVTLYKNQQSTNPLTSMIETEILVIDPSNFKFSNHLSSFFLELDHNIQSISKIVTLGAIDYKIYKPVSATGPAFNEARDCTDISIKIALDLNQSQYIFDTSSQEILKKSISNCTTIRYVSNQDDFDKSVDISADSTARIKQSSNPQISQDYNKLARLLHNKYKFIASEIKNPEDRDQYITDQDNVFAEILVNNSPIIYEDQLNRLSILHKSYCETFDEYTPIIGDSSSDCCTIM